MIQGFAGILLSLQMWTFSYLYSALVCCCSWWICPPAILLLPGASPLFELLLCNYWSDTCRCGWSQPAVKLLYSEPSTRQQTPLKECCIPWKPLPISPGNRFLDKIFASAYKGMYFLKPSLSNRGVFVHIFQKCTLTSGMLRELTC